MIPRYKSIPEMWAKERDGRKPNTLRKVHDTDKRIIALRDDACDYIEIENTETGQVFKREITDYTEWEGWAIISWKHEKEE